MIKQRPVTNRFSVDDTNIGPFYFTVQKERFMSEGKVKWFNSKKGYGFIATSDGRDIFVHFSNISSDGFKILKEGDLVSFDIAEGDKGIRAENVSVISQEKRK